MTPKKLAKIKQELEAMRKSPRGIQHRSLEKLAGQLGRKTCKRGKEPTFVRNEPPVLDVLTIPRHKPELRVGTAKSVIEQLLNDCDCWEIHLEMTQSA